MKWILFIMMMPAASAGEPPSASKNWSHIVCDAAQIDVMVERWATTSCGTSSHDTRRTYSPDHYGTCDVHASVWCGKPSPEPTTNKPSPPPVVVPQPSNCHPPFGGVPDQYREAPVMVFRDEHCSSRNAGEYWPITDPLDQQLMNDGKNDWMSSLSVKAGWRLDIYEHENMRGKFLTVCGPVEMPDLHDYGNDLVSSLKVAKGDPATLGCDPGSVTKGVIPDPIPVPPAECQPPYSGMDSRYANPGIMFFQDERCGGRGDGQYWPITDVHDYPDLRGDGKNDWASALSVKTGWQLEIYQDIDFKGSVWTICGPVVLSDLRAFGNDTVSSFRARSSSPQCDPGKVYEGSISDNTLGRVLFGQ